MNKVEEYRSELEELENKINKLKVESQVTENEIQRLLTELKDSGIDVSDLKDLDIVKINLQEEIKKLESELEKLKETV